MGSITIPNPTGTSVNIIFTRTTDSKKITFSQYLPSGIKQFKIPALLDQTGKYYLAIFPGFQGWATQDIYTVNPGFIGKIVSRTPNPVKSAELVFKGNELEAKWTTNDVQPCITKLIF